MFSVDFINSLRAFSSEVPTFYSEVGAEAFSNEKCPCDSIVVKACFVSIFYANLLAFASGDLTTLESCNNKCSELVDTERNFKL